MPDVDALPACPFPALRDHVLAHSVQEGDFTLKSGKRSRWFIDAKQTTCSPEGMVLVADALLEVLPDDVTALGGLTVGADAAAYATAAIATERGRPLRAFTVRKEDKGHGMGGRVAGVLGPGDRVAVTEDAVTRGVSMLEAVEVIRAVGAEAVGGEWANTFLTLPRLSLGEINLRSSALARDSLRLQLRRKASEQSAC